MIPEGRPNPTAPDRRYWRRRANRRVRKARLTRGALRGAKLLLFNGLVGILLFWAASRAHEAFTSTGEFALGVIAIDGTERASRLSMQRRLQPLLGRNLFDLDLDVIGKSLADEPWARSIAVRRVLPDTLRVTVIERVPCAVALIRGAHHVVDTDGHVVERADPRRDAALPMLVGLEEMSDARLIEALGRGVRAAQRLRARAPDWLASIVELDLSHTDRITVRQASGEPEIRLDPERIDRNVDEYLTLRGEIEHGIGPLDYVDLRWKDRITVRPATKDYFAKER